MGSCAFGAGVSRELSASGRARATAADGACAVGAYTSRGWLTGVALLRAERWESRAGCRVCVQCCLPRREHNTRRLSDLPIFTDVSFGICVCSFMKTRYCGRAGRSSRKYTLMLRPASQLSDNVSHRRARYVTRNTRVTGVYAGTTSTSGRSS